MGKADNGILKVSVTIGARRFEEDLAAQAATAPDIEGLNRNLAEHPGRFAEWAMLEALARQQCEELDARVKFLDAELFEKYQATLSVTVAKPTLDAIKARVTMDSRMVALSAEARGARASLEQLTVGRQTMQMKRDTLLALASNWRAEMDSNLVIARRTAAGFGSKGPQGADVPWRGANKPTGPRGA
mgnify:CR=1 FL=1